MGQLTRSSLRAAQHFGGTALVQNEAAQDPHISLSDTSSWGIRPMRPAQFLALPVVRYPLPSGVGRFPIQRAW